MVIIPKGSLFTISTGEYEDYSVDGVFRALADIDAAALRDEWISMDPRRSERHGFVVGDFTDWLFESALLEPVATHEWHISAHPELMDVTEPDGE